MRVVLGVRLMGFPPPPIQKTIWVCVCGCLCVCMCVCVSAYMSASFSIIMFPSSPSFHSASLSYSRRFSSCAVLPHSSYQTAPTPPLLHRLHRNVPLWFPLCFSRREPLCYVCVCILICFIESWPQQWLLTGRSIMRVWRD